MSPETEVHWTHEREIQGLRVIRTCSTCGGEMQIGESAKRIVWFDGYGDFGEIFEHSPSCKERLRSLGFR